MIALCLSGVFQALKHTKTRFLPGSRPGPRRGSLRCSPYYLVGWGGDTPPHSLPPRRLRHLDCLAPPLTSLKFVLLALRSERLDTPDIE